MATLASLLQDISRLPHAAIVSAPSREEGLAAARKLAAAALCVGGGPVPCGRCSACRKVMAGIHPDVITVRRAEDDKGRPKRELGVDAIRRMGADAYVLPNEAARKLYLIEDADTMNLPAQNAALKLLEEPPGGVHFLLCVTNPAPLLPTVRSRCAEIVCAGEQEAADEESLKLARAFVKTVAGGDRAELCRWCGQNEGLDSRAAAAFLEGVQALLADMLCARAKAPGLTAGELLRLSALAERCRAYLRVNVGVKQIFGLLSVDAIEGGGNRG